ncbi:hypothetical protein CANARDRAFT_9057 [[Candida] arabinofermentans NRRL YB-2248]|uniref:Sphingoid long-chain base transporter RSB1 n=1 Tax=[Candida] arabinofermentans NRRL YB-2248 TaxID=983967 RepID=A0A1E4SX26_9ASCO|nr:hypothetical protein CANARDRAFT_9057 [[Candida] arabinofermentans NRRL YB-2248]
MSSSNYNYYGYTPSVSANSVFLSLMAIFWVIHIVYLVIYKQLFTSFLLLIALTAEIIGYSARLASSNDPTSLTIYMIQSITIAIGPGFFTSTIYLMMVQVSVIMSRNPEATGLRTSWFVVGFVSFNIVAVIVQVVGSSNEANATTISDLNHAKNTVVAGCAIQIAVNLSVQILWFLSLFNWLRKGYFTHNSHLLGELHQYTRNRWQLKLFVLFLSVCIELVFSRMVFRLVEMSQGYTSELIKKQGYYIVFESGVISLAFLLITICFSGYAFGKGVNVQIGEKDVRFNPDGTVRKYPRIQPKGFIFKRLLIMVFNLGQAIKEKLDTDHQATSDISGFNKDVESCDEHKATNYGPSSRFEPSSTDVPPLYQSNQPIIRPIYQESTPGYQIKTYPKEERSRLPTDKGLFVYRGFALAFNTVQAMREK